MTLAKIFSKESNNLPVSGSPEVTASKADEEILHLKRLLVTLKQHYEKSLQTSQAQLQAEESQRLALQEEVKKLQTQWNEHQKLHEEELLALATQQSSLKELLKKTKGNLNPDQNEASPDTSSSTQHVLPAEIKILEIRYGEILNEKIELERQMKVLQQQFENQSAHLTSFQSQLHKTNEQKKILEENFRLREVELSERTQQCRVSQNQIQELERRRQEISDIQEKYEQLKDEWIELREHLEGAIEMRCQAESHLAELKSVSSHQALQVQEVTDQLKTLREERSSFEAERNQFKNLLDETETRLKMAQQHLAKKVKEVTLLNERTEEQQMALSNLAQTFEQQKTQIVQLQANVDIYQRQEQRFQEQLRDALKGNDAQVSKWEEKYFSMYDKWQQSENTIRELRKFEEKHHQVQNLLANLGNFMGNSLNSPNVVYQNGTESTPQESGEYDEKYDLFGMRHP